MSGAGTYSQAAWKDLRFDIQTDKIPPQWFPGCGQKLNDFLLKVDEWRLLANYDSEGAKVVATVEDAITMAENVAFIEGQEEAVIMGGAEIYALALPQTERLYLTEVHADVEGDTFFPEYATAEWQEIGREDFAAEGPNPYDYSFVVYERK